MKKPPLFIVGMPRSGTKFLRALLNNHPQISILNIETEFLPYWVINWEKWGGEKWFKKYEHFSQFYKKTIKLPYFLYKKKQNDLISPAVWFKNCENYLVSGVFESLARHDAKADETMYWGDKSPGYIRHIPLLKQIFPYAKIVHIVRDPRDYCLSINKAWGKNMLRAAQRWVDDVSTAHRQGAAFKEDYLEVHFEKLLDDPEKILREICDFLGLSYCEQMLALENPTENLGDAKGQSRIVSDNKHKWIYKINSKTLEKMEAICSKQMHGLGYPVSYRGPEKRIGNFYSMCMKIFDGVNLIKNNKDKKGIPSVPMKSETPTLEKLRKGG